MRTMNELARIGQDAATTALRDQERMPAARIAGAQAIRDAVVDDAVEWVALWYGAGSADHLRAYFAGKEDITGDRLTTQPVNE